MKVDIQDVFVEWEVESDIRGRFRRSGRMFIPTPSGEFPWVNIKTAGRHFEVLLPLVKAMRQPNDELPIGMVTISDLEREITSLHETVRPGQTIDKTIVHGEAWLCKKFCVLVKRKLSRGQYCRDPRFRALLHELSPPEDTEDHDGRSTSDDSDANVDDDDNDDHAGGPVHVPAEEAIVLDDDDEVDRECDGPKDPAQELAHPIEPVIPELSSQRMDEVDECPMNGDEVLTGDGEIPLTQEAAKSPQQEDNDSQEEESCPTNLLTSFDDADISEDEEEKDAPQKPDSETQKNEDKQDAKHKPVTEKKGWKDLPNTKQPSIPFLEKKLAALRRQQTASSAKKSVPSSSSSSLKDEVVVVNDSLPYGEDNAETQEPLDDVEDIMNRLKAEAPPIDEDMSEHSVLRRQQLHIKASSMDDGDGDDNALTDGKTDDGGKKPKGKGKGKGRGGKGKGKGKGKVKKPTSTKKPGKAKKTEKEQSLEGSAGSEPTKKHKRKSKEADVGKDVSEGKETEEGGEAPKKPKRVRNPGGSVTFARRYKPSSSFGAAKWDAIRNAFVAEIKPHLSKFSEHEDHFWMFCGKEWEGQEVSESNVEAAAIRAALDYVATKVQL